MDKFLRVKKKEREKESFLITVPVRRHVVAADIAADGVGDGVGVAAAGADCGGDKDRGVN